MDELFYYIDLINLNVMSHLHVERSILLIFFVHTFCASVNEEQVTFGCISDVGYLPGVADDMIKLLLQIDGYPKQLVLGKMTVKGKMVS